MSPTSYRAAPSRDIHWRRKRDSNPCAVCTTSRFSRPVPSTRLGYSSNSSLFQTTNRLYHSNFIHVNKFYVLFLLLYSLFHYIIIKRATICSSYYIDWCLRPDLNRHEGWFSQDFKSCASTNSATQATMVTCMRFELMTLWLKVKCSTNWANRSYQ